MRTTASERQSSLELYQAVSRLLDGIHLGEFDLDEVRHLAGQALQGGGAEDDDTAVVRGVTALLGPLKFVNIDSLQPGGCGCMLPAALDQITLFCKGSCTVNADDGTLSIADTNLGEGEEVTGMGEGRYD
eukprot:g1117.t1